MPIGWLYTTYHLVQEPEKSIGLTWFRDTPDMGFYIQDSPHLDQFVVHAALDLVGKPGKFGKIPSLKQTSIWDSLGFP